MPQWPGSGEKHGLKCFLRSKCPGQNPRFSSPKNGSKYESKQLDRSFPGVSRNCEEMGDCASCPPIHWGLAGAVAQCCSAAVLQCCSGAAEMEKLRNWQLDLKDNLKIWVMF